MLQDAQHRLRIGCALYHTVVNTFVQLRLDVLTGKEFFIVDIGKVSVFGRINFDVILRKIDGQLFNTKCEMIEDRLCPA